MTPKGQETAASVLEGLSDAPPGSLTGNLARLRPSELDSAKRLMSQYGLDLKVSTHVGEEVADALGRTYDFTGTPKGYAKGNMSEILQAIYGHVAEKVNDFTVVDLKGATADQIKQIKDYVGTLSKELQDKIIYIN